MTPEQIAAANAERERIMAIIQRLKERMYWSSRIMGEDNRLAEQRENDRRALQSWEQWRENV